MSKKPVLIVEHCDSGLKLCENKSSSQKFIMEGVFTEFDVKNRNDRIYTPNGFLPHLDELLERKKQLGVIFGEFDHPDVFDTSLSRVSHVVENAWYNKEKNRVDGQIILLDTHWGKEAKAIVKEGYPIFVSSRAAGVTDSTGRVELKKLFTYDCVADPGFSSAKMSLKSVNESLGIKEEDVPYRLYEAPEQLYKKYSKVFDLSNETKTNELFEMNKNDLVTKKQLVEYSDYLVKELNNTKQSINKLIKESKSTEENKNQLTQLAEYYEALNEQNEKVIKYLDYLTSKVKLVVNENTKLKETTKILETKTNKLEKENKSLTKTLNKSIDYQNYLAENLDKTISYSDYLAENLDKNISYSEYLAENLDKNISYSEYLAENLDKNISYSEYLAENLDKNISYSEYLAENLDKNISYSEYIAENLDKNISYSEYIAENLNTSIKYQEYLAENLDTSIKYTEYVAEAADATIDYSGMIAETLNENAGSLNEGVHIQSPTEYLKGKMKTVSDADGDALKQKVKKSSIGTAAKTHKGRLSRDGQPQTTVVDKAPTEYLKGDMKKVKEEPGKDIKPGKDLNSNESIKDENVENISEVKQFTSGKLTSKIDMLINEAKKREASIEKEPHFYKFLNRSQIKAFESLKAEEQENIKVALNESSYYSAKDVLTIMRRVLNAKQVSPEEKLLSAMPKEYEKVWESLDSTQKKSIIAQSKFYVLDSEDKIENFWKTRKLGVKSLNETKKLIQKDELELNEKLSEDQINSFMERFERLK